MFNSEKFLQYNEKRIRQVCLFDEQVDLVIREIKAIQVKSEKEFLEKLKDIFKKYGVHYTNLQLVTESVDIANIDLYDEWSHVSYS